MAITRGKDYGGNAMNIYSIDTTGLSRLSNLLWESSPDFWNSLTGVIENAIQCIVSLHIIPHSFVNGGGKPFFLGNKTISDIGTYICERYYTKISDESVYVPEYYSTVLDYAPYTTVKIYLPFCGIFDLDPAHVVGKSVRIYQQTDMVTGDICFSLESGNSENGYNMLYHFSGNCRASLPLSASDYSRFFRDIAGGVGSAVSLIGNAAMGNSMGAVSSGISAAGSALSAIHDYNTPNVQMANNVSGCAGWLSSLEPCFIVSRPQTHVAVDYDEYIAYPSLMTKKLDELSGLTSVAAIHLDNVSATDNEKSELESLLMRGVIL